MEPKSFLFLLSLNAANAKIGKSILAKVQRDIDPSAAPLWLDARGIGVFMTTTLAAWKAWQQLFPQTLTRDEQLLMKDALLVQVGPDHFGAADSKPIAWLNSRFPTR